LHNQGRGLALLARSNCPLVRVSEHDSDAVAALHRAQRDGCVLRVARLVELVVEHGQHLSCRIFVVGILAESD
jgi:hypothetical protein